MCHFPHTHTWASHLRQGTKGDRQKTGVSQYAINRSSSPFPWLYFCLYIPYIFLLFEKNIMVDDRILISFRDRERNRKNLTLLCPRKLVSPSYPQPAFIHSPTSKYLLFPSEASCTDLCRETSLNFRCSAKIPSWLLTAQIRFNRKDLSNSRILKTSLYS